MINLESGQLWFYNLVPEITGCNFRLVIEWVENPLYYTHSGAFMCWCFGDGYSHLVEVPIDIDDWTGWKLAE